MRLTLRTLLAYLDDTLPPGEIKAIGQKVAESDTAQELIERIKTVMRRRRLTTPPSNGPGALDANTVAEYLDNELSSELVADLEKLALESDVHLAEVAATHQILTLVLGEPLQVPPTAKERMYGLVQGRESLASRKAPRNANGSADGPDQEADENLLPGLSLFNQAPWLRWALPVAGGVLLLLLGVGLGIVLSRGPQSPATDKDRKGTEVAQANTDRRGDTGSRPEPTTPTTPTEPKPVDPLPTEPKPMDPKINDPKPMDPKATEPKPPVEVEGPRDPGRLTTIPPPSDDRKVVGRYHPFERNPSILVARKGANDLERVPDGGEVNSADLLVSLPDFISQIDFPKGGQLLLRGQIPEIARLPRMRELLESAVTLHANAEVDVDLTLHRGRIFLTNNKPQGTLRVRLRLTSTETWDLILDPGSEVLVDLFRAYLGGGANWKDEEPFIQSILVVLKGKLTLKVDANTYGNMEPAPGLNLYIWDNHLGTTTPKRTPEDLAGELRALWDKQQPLTGLSRGRDLEFAPEGLSALMGQKKPGPALSEALASDQRGKRLLAIYALGALDLLPKLIDVLSDGDEARNLERDTAVFVLRRWLSHGPESSKKLVAEFVLKGYTPTEANIAVTLLHDFPEDAARKTETYDLLLLYMNDRNRVAVRELGWSQLQRLTSDPRLPPVKLPAFNASWGEDQRRPALDEIRKLLREGKLPPNLPQQPQPPMRP